MPSSSFALPMAIFLVLLVFLVAATLGTSIGRGVFEFLNKYMPENIGVNWQSTTDDSISDYSANAVACAAYSVGKGAELSCVSSVYTKPSGIGGGKQTVYDYSAPSDSFSMASSVSGFAAADTSIDTSTIQPSKKSWVTCEYDATYTNMESCTVHNFRMPQYIDSVEKDKWIPLHGDPEYLLYWNLYPPEEDTWTYDGPGWKMNVAIGIISVLPVGKVFSLGTRLARSAAAKAIPALAPSAMKDRKSVV